MKEQHRINHKAVRLICIFLLLFFVFSFTGCSDTNTIDNGTKLASFSTNAPLPLRAIKTDALWFMVRGTFGKPGGEIAVGQTVESVQSVYKVPDLCTVEAFSAEGQAVVWSEVNEEHVRFMLYDHGAEATSEIASFDHAKNTQIAVHQGKIYFIDPMSDTHADSLKCYDPQTKTCETVYTWNDGEIHAMDAKAGHLILALHGDDGSMHTADFDLSKITQPNLFVLPQGIAVIHGIAKDVETGATALYYTSALNGEPVIGIWYPGMETVRSLFAFTLNFFAADNEIAIKDGMVYWVTEAVIPGGRNNHYRIIAMDITTSQPTEYMRAFSFSFDQDTLVYLRFDSNNRTDRISLFQK